MKSSKEQILVGNAFPLSLIRRTVKITEWTLERFRERSAKATIVSFWGHENTRMAAEAVLGVELTPATMRPAIALSEYKLPIYNGTIFDEVYILSPDYMENFRPAIGEEVALNTIAGWHILRLAWDKEGGLKDE